MDFFTANICDEHIDKVLVLDPDFINYGGVSRCQGKVVTIKLDKNNNGLIELLRDEDGSGKVVVVDVREEYFAVVGENLMKLAYKNNYAGIIVNGYIRDTLQIKDIPVALFAIGVCPRKYIPVTESIRGEHLSFGGIGFEDGDYIYADNDGIIVTPEKLI